MSEQHPIEITITARDATGREARRELEFWASHPDPEKAIGEITASSTWRYQSA